MPLSKFLLSLKIDEKSFCKSVVWVTCLHAMPLYHNYPCFKYPPNLIAYSRVPNKHKDMFINPNWHRAWDAFISLSFLDKKFANSASNFKSFSRSLEQFFLTVGQNNFGNKIPFLDIITVYTAPKVTKEKWGPSLAPLDPASGTASLKKHIFAHNKSYRWSHTKGKSRNTYIRSK